MPTEEQELLNHICDYPYDRLSRLVYADWLEGQHGVYGSLLRSEFIRVQDELYGKPDCPDWCDGDPKKCRVSWLEKREKELLGLITDPKLTEIFIPTNPKNWEWKYRRGFVAHLRSTAFLFQDHGPELVRASPIVSVDLTAVNMKEGWPWCPLEVFGDRCVCDDSAAALRWARANDRNGTLRKMPELSMEQ